MYKLHHLCIQTSDYEASVAFYKTVLGFQVDKETENFHGRAYNTWLSHGALKIEMQTHKDEESAMEFDRNSNGLAHFGLFVDDLDDAYEKIKALGYTNFKQKNGADIYEVFGGRLMKLIAPEGTIIEIRDTWDI